MADVSTWSPTDESNTSAPPDGFPEYMMPAALNNSSRAVMGAVRRMYDQLLAGSGGGMSLPYLPLTGGTVSGGTTFNGGITTTNINASGSVSSGYVTSTGNVNANNAVTVAGQLSLGYNGVSYFGSNAIAYTWDGHVQVWVDRSRQGRIAIADDNNNLTLNGFYGSYLHSTGNVQADGAIVGGYVHSTGDVVADGSLYCGGGGGPHWYNNAGYMICDSTLRTFGILPTANNNSSCGSSSPAYAWSYVVYYNLYPMSSRELKQDIAPMPTGMLDKVKALQPSRFRWRDGREPERPHLGFILDEVRDVFGDNFGVYHRDIEGGGGEALEPQELVAVLWQAVRELAAELRAVREATGA